MAARKFKEGDSVELSKNAIKYHQERYANIVGKVIQIIPQGYNTQIKYRVTFKNILSGANEHCDFTANELVLSSLNANSPDITRFLNLQASLQDEINNKTRKLCNIRDIITYMQKFSKKQFDLHEYRAYKIIEVTKDMSLTESEKTTKITELLKMH